jgi:hypothetical protein
MVSERRRQGTGAACWRWQFNSMVDMLDHFLHLKQQWDEDIVGAKDLEAYFYPQ